MHLDARGLPLSTASANAASAYDHLITGYLTQRADTPARLTALLEADPDFARAHCMQGYFAMLALGQIQAVRYARNLVYKVDRETVGHHFNNIHRLVIPLSIDRKIIDECLVGSDALPDQ